MHGIRRKNAKKLFSRKMPVWKSTIDSSQIHHPFFSLFSFVNLLSFRQIGWAATPHSLQSGDQGGIASPSPQVHAWTAIYLATLLEVYEDVFLLLVVATSLSFSTFPAKTSSFIHRRDPAKIHIFFSSGHRHVAICSNTSFQSSYPYLPYFLCFTLCVRHSGC